MSSNSCSLNSVVEFSADGGDPTFQMACLMGMVQGSVRFTRGRRRRPL